MFATTEDGKTVNIGRDFVEALSGGYVWHVKAGKYLFTVNYNCSMDNAIQHCKDILAKERKHTKCESFIAQRHYKGFAGFGD